MRVTATLAIIAIAVGLTVQVERFHIGSPGPAAAAAATLQAAKDNTLYQDPAGSTSNGAGSYFFVGRTNNGELRRGLIAFDVASNIPAGSTITSVTLTLRMSRTQAATETIELRKVLADWGEGTSNADQQEGSGAPATTGDATWIHRFYNTSFWSSAGGDFSPTVSASTAVAGNGTYTWSSAQMVADVQSWLNNPSTNFGWLVLGNETVNQTAKRFDSRQNNQASNRPALLLEYTAPTATATATATGPTATFTSTPTPTNTSTGPTPTYTNTAT